MNISEIRRINLTRIIDDEFNGNVASLAAAMEVQPSTLYRALGDPNAKGYRGIGPKNKERIEKVSRKEPDWLDHIHDADQQSSFELDKNLLAQCIATIESYLSILEEDMIDPELKADFIVQCYKLGYDQPPSIIAKIIRAGKSYSNS